MGKGSGICEREALELEAAPRFKFGVRPRGKRTSWESSDGRIFYAKRAEGWRVNYGFWNPKDREVLEATGFIDDMGRGLLYFKTLKETVNRVRGLYQGMNLNPPSSEVRQRPTHYEISGIPFTVIKWVDEWKLKEIKEGGLFFNRNCPQEMKSKLWELRDQAFPTRKAALQELEKWCRENYRELDTLGFFDEYSPKNQELESG